MNPVKFLSDLGLQSKHAYWGGFASIVIALVAWLASQGKDSTTRPSPTAGASSSATGRRPSSRSASP